MSLMGQIVAIQKAQALVASGMALPGCTAFVGFRGTVESEEGMEQGYRGSQVNCFSIRADSQTFAGPLSFQAITIVLV